MILHSIGCDVHLNLYNTDEIARDEYDVDNSQEHCLHVADIAERKFHSYWFYCLAESPTKFLIEKSDLFVKYTFEQLSKNNITSEQLFLWSAPIDLIERYQFYLDDLEKSSSENDVFYRCSSTRFGPLCQYELEYLHPESTSLYKVIQDYYKTLKSDSENLTCYMNMKCDRGYVGSCLHWSEICDGVVDCVDSGEDEKNCWQLEMNECSEDQYRCWNGQCIPRAFYADQEKDTYDCLDGSDQRDDRNIITDLCENIEMRFKCEDIQCRREGLTSSCHRQRQHLLIKSMFSIKDPLASSQCWSAFQCIMYIYPSNDKTCVNICKKSACIEIIERECPSRMFIPTVPFVYHEIYLFYENNSWDMFENGQLNYLYMCPNSSSYEDYFHDDLKIFLRNLTCYRHLYRPTFRSTTRPSGQPSMFEMIHEFHKYYQVYQFDSTYCNRSNTYQCRNSNKCISKYRRNNGIIDCLETDDEDANKIEETIIPYPNVDFNTFWIDYSKKMTRYLRLNISFQSICNGYTELYPILIDQFNHTDETNCEQWECNNLYTRCDDRWNCLNGEDELNCLALLTNGCPSNCHQCVSSLTYELICLPIEKANDGHVDCLGGTDEPNLCRQNYEFGYPDLFYCLKNQSKLCINGERLCNKKIDCDNRDDENFCENEEVEDWKSDYCHTWHPPDGLTAVEQVLCKTLKSRHGNPFIFFSIPGLQNLDVPLTNNLNRISFSKSIESIQRCYYGLDVRVWLNETESSSTCFCPPNFYGAQCQYEKKRIIIAMKFRAPANSWEIFFGIIITVIDYNDDNEKRIHYSDQISYLSSRDCDRKYSIYLFYPNQKQRGNYSIEINIYEKFSLKYRGSLFYPIEFDFLPVYHFSIFIDIPSKSPIDTECVNLQCIHGQCMKYSNNIHQSFCHCHPGWTGKFCEKKLNCQCSSDSLCLGILSSQNRSICLCRPNRFGPRCLINTICQMNNKKLCRNNGQCIPDDHVLDFEESYSCLCPKGFTGDRCEDRQSKLVITFEKYLHSSERIFFHFIQIIEENFPTRLTTFATNLLGKDSWILYWSERFHVAFIEIPHNRYYFVLTQRTSFPSRSTLRKRISKEDFCPHVNQIFNETFVQMPLIRQMKFYHLACQISRLNLSCFYDEVHLCLCYSFEGKRLANCFHFIHNETMNCLGSSECQNDGQCYQDAPSCPKRSICLCQECFYGRLCQFHTNGFGASLDGILSYQIEQNQNLHDQPVIVRISFALTIIFVIIGLINSIISISTFQSQIIREVGCGLYLFTLSIITLLTTILFGLKYWILIFSQMNIITNEIFLSYQCYSLDFLLRVCLNIDQWLNSCIAVERAYTVIKDTRFSKAKSKQIAKVVLIILFVSNLANAIHDPIHRKLIVEDNKDDDEKRIWCIVTYSHSLRIYNSISFIVHFLVPFLINLISSIILIMKKSLQKSRLQNQVPFHRILKQQIEEHKNLLFAPIVLILLAIPRLILSFISKCMNSSNDSWLFLCGYFISFIPPMLTALLFIYPSTFYKKEFYKVVARYRDYFQRRFRRI